MFFKVVEWKQVELHFRFLLVLMMSTVIKPLSHKKDKHMPQILLRSTSWK